MVETTVPGEQGYSVVLIERTHYYEENGKHHGTQNNLVDRACGCLPVLMGPKGMEKSAAVMTNAKYAAKLVGIPGVSLRFHCSSRVCGNFDKTGKTVEEINQQLLSRQILAAWTCPGIILNLSDGRSVLCNRDLQTKKS